MCKLLKTVQDVIDELNKIEDKTQKFIIHKNENEFEWDYSVGMYDIYVQQNKDNVSIEIYR